MSICLYVCCVFSVLTFRLHGHLIGGAIVGSRWAFGHMCVFFISVRICFVVNHLLFLFTLLIMGIDTAIRKWLRDRVAPEAWGIHLPTEKGLVVVEDLLIALMSTQWSKYLSEMTGSMMFENIWHRVQTVLMMDHATGYVLIVDDKLNVQTKQMKSRVHDERRRAKEATLKANNEKFKIIAERKSQETGEEVVAERDLSQTPYPDDYEITDSGEFDIRRLLAGDRTKIWIYLLNKMKKKHIPPNKVVIFEYSKEAPWLFQELGAVQAKEMYHDHGEFDVSQLYFINYFAKHPIRIVTTDTDVIPIIFGYMIELQTMKKDKELLNPRIDWQYTNQEVKPLARFGKDKAPYYVVDMLKMARIIEARLELSLKDFVIGIYLSKTDHVDKSLICNNYGFESIIEAVRLLSLSVAKRDQGPRPPGWTSKRYIYAFHRLLVSTKLRTMSPPANYEWDSNEIVVYKAEYKEPDVDLTVPLPPEQLTGREKPTEAAFEELYQQLCFNLQYWLKDWQQYAPLHDRTHVRDFYTDIPAESDATTATKTTTTTTSTSQLTGMRRFFTAQPSSSSSRVTPQKRKGISEADTALKRKLVAH